MISEKSLQTHFSELMYVAQKKANKKAYQEPRKNSFRGSSLPICKIQWVFNQITRDLAEEPIKKFNVDMFSDYFLNEGTLIHLLLQRWNGLGGSIYGRWQCQNPKCPKGKLKKKKINGKLVKKWIPYTTKLRIGSEICCGLPMDYVEIDILDGPFSGHIDLIFTFNGKWYIADFKTSKSAWDKNFEIPGNYIHQLNSYYWWVQRNHEKLGIPELSGAMVIFIPRDYYCLNPNKWKFIPIKPDKKLWLEDKQEHKLASKCVSKKSYKLFKSFELKDRDTCYGKYETCWMCDICYSDDRLGICKKYFERWKKAA